MRAVGERWQRAHGRRGRGSGFTYGRVLSPDEDVVQLALVLEWSPGLYSARGEKIRSVGLSGEAAVARTCDARSAGPSGRGERRMWLRHGVRGAQGAGVGKPAVGPSKSLTRMIRDPGATNPDRLFSR